MHQSGKLTPREPHINVNNVPIYKIETTLGSLYIGMNSRNAIKHYVREANSLPITRYIVNNHLHGARVIELITFTHEDVDGLNYPIVML